MKVKVEKLEGVALDWAVASHVEYLDAYPKDGGGFEVQWVQDDVFYEVGKEYSPSTNWNQGGKLIERYGIGVAKFYEPVDGAVKQGCEWVALWRDDSVRMDGPTPLIAAMRGIVAKHRGLEIDIPDELLT